MRRVDDWDHYHMSDANQKSTRSKDPNTQVGAVVVDKHNHPITSGYNGFVPGAEETDELWERPAKYDRVIHAELNAIAHAAKVGHATDGCTLYTTHFPCLECAKAIIAAGIVKVVVERNPPGWEDSNAKAQARFDEAGVETSILYPHAV